MCECCQEVVIVADQSPLSSARQVGSERESETAQVGSYKLLVSVHHCDPGDGTVLSLNIAAHAPTASPGLCVSCQHLQ